MYPVPEMGRIVPRQSPDQFKFDVVGAERVEQPSPAAEQDRREMDLHLVELPCLQQRLRRAGPCTITARSPAAARG